MPIGKLQQVKDFLPAPEFLFSNNEKVRVTVYLSKFSLDYLKKQAQQHHTKYQRMVRELIDQYVSQHAG